MDDRTLLLITTIVSLLLMLVSVYYLNAFREQRLVARANEIRLSEWQNQLLTATPAAIERERLRGQLDQVRLEFAQASGLLPGTDVESQIQERVLEAAALSGVEVTTLNKVGDSFQEGALVGWEYELGAKGSLPRLTEFVSRLEEEAFPVALVNNPLINKRPDGDHALSGELLVYGSTLSTSALTADTPLLPGELNGNLRQRAQSAIERGDYELALSALLQLAALEPDNPEIDGLLYDTYVRYAQSLLAMGYPQLAEEQAEAALALNPSGQEAVALLVAIAEDEGNPATGTTVVIAVGSGTPSSGGGNVSTPSGTTTAYATRTPLPTREVPPTVPAPATAYTTRTPYNYPTRTPYATIYVPPTPHRSATPRPSSTVNNATPTITPDVSLTPTGGVPQSTATRTSIPNPYPYGSTGTFYLPNCGLTQAKGYIKSATGVPINGIVVRVWWDGAAANQVYSFPSGSYANLEPGYWDVVLDSRPKAGKWYINVVDPATGQPLSDVVTAYTDTNGCQPNGGGHQIVLQDFIRWQGPGGTPVPTSTTGPTPTATRTGTPTRTPTATPTPPPALYIVDEEPDLVIPDFPAGPALSETLIGDTTILRDARVFLNVAHEDVGDLEIDLVHPDGAFVRLHEIGQDSGQTTIRRWVNIDGIALQAIAGKSIEGQWTLRVRDGIEGLTGTLLSWQLEVYP